jgi:hypothetical protein
VLKTELEFVLFENRASIREALVNASTVKECREAITQHIRPPENPRKWTLKDSIDRIFTLIESKEITSTNFRVLLRWEVERSVTISRTQYLLLAAVLYEAAIRALEIHSKQGLRWADLQGYPIRHCRSIEVVGIKPAFIRSRALQEAGKKTHCYHLQWDPKTGAPVLMAEELALKKVV